MITALIQDSDVVQEGGIAFIELRRGKPSITIWDLPEKFKPCLKRQPQMIVQEDCPKVTTAKITKPSKYSLQETLFSILHSWWGEFHLCALKNASQLFDN